MTVISLRVSVPVLSVHTTVQPPSVSTAASRRTSALRFAMRCTPSASETLTAVGSPSGIAETAAATANSSHLDDGLAAQHAQHEDDDGRDHRQDAQPHRELREPPLQRRVLPLGRPHLAGDLAHDRAPCRSR